MKRHFNVMGVQNKIEDLIFGGKEVVRTTSFPVSNSEQIPAVRFSPRPGEKELEDQFEKHVEDRRTSFGSVEDNIIFLTLLNNKSISNTDWNATRTGGSRGRYRKFKSFGRE